MIVVRKSIATPGDMHVNSILTNILSAYMQDDRTFMADKIFPPVAVSKQSGIYYKWDKATFLSAYAKPRAPSSESAGGKLGLSTDSYSALVSAFHADVDDQLRANVDSPLSLDDAATQLVSRSLMLAREKTWIDTYFKTGVWAHDVVPNPKWDAVGATPLKDVETAKTTMLSETGYLPNKMVMGRQVFAALKDSAPIRDQFKYTSANSIDEAMIARYFGVDRLYIADAVGSTDGGVTYGLLAGKSVLMVHAPDAPSLMTPSAGYTFVWTGYTGAVDGVRIKRFRMEPIESDRIEGGYAFDMKITGADLGYFLSAVIS